MTWGHSSRWFLSPRVQPSGLCSKARTTSLIKARPRIPQALDVVPTDDLIIGATHEPSHALILLTPPDPEFSRRSFSFHPRPGGTPRRCGHVHPALQGDSEGGEEWRVTCTFEQWIWTSSKSTNVTKDKRTVKNDNRNDRLL